MEHIRDLEMAWFGNDHWGKGNLSISNKSDQQNKYNINLMGYK